VPKGNHIIRNLHIGGEWVALHDNLTEEIIHFEDNLLDTDPRFVDPEAEDFRLRPDSPALELGFRPLPLEKVGPR
jgi:hypothetical protein